VKWVSIWTNYEIPYIGLHDSACLGETDPRAFHTGILFSKKHATLPICTQIT